MMARPVEEIVGTPMFVEDPEALNDLGMPNYYGKIKTPDEFMAAGIEFDQTSRFGDYSLADLKKLGIRQGTRITGIDANTFTALDYPTKDPSTWRDVTYTKTPTGWVAAKTETGRDKEFLKLGDVFKIAAPLLLGAIPGVGAGISAAFGGGFGGTVASRAVIGGLSSGLQGGNIARGALSGGLGAGISSALTPMFGTGFAGRAVTSAITSGTVAKATGGDPFSAAVLGAVGGANVGRTLGLEGASARFVNDLAKITARSQLARRKQRGG